VRIETAGAWPGGEAFTTDDALRLAAAVDSASLHPIARGLLAAARDRDLAVPPPEDVRAFPGLGVEATIAGRRLALGSARLAERRGVPLPSTAPGETAVVHLLEGAALLASFHFAELPRPDAPQALAALRRLGLDVEILTGDRPAAAARLTRALGVPVTAGLLPEEKVAHLEALRAAGGGAVGMVGDGINDAPVLAAADVGFAIATAADLARRAGSVRLVHDRLDRIPLAVALARDAMRRVRLNLAWAFGYNAIGLTLAAQGRLTPIFAASTMIVSSLVIIAVSRGAGRSAARGSSPGPAGRTVTQPA
jgi:P-type E1-E2 ATPase